jgi:hypothetical protein
MANLIADLNKMVNTFQKVDKLLTEKPKRTRTRIKPTFDTHLRNLVEYILLQPRDVRQQLINESINNLKEL